MMAQYITVDGRSLYRALFTHTAFGDPGIGGDDVIYGGSGNDFIGAGAGDDFVDAGPGDDWVYGEAGDDALLGGEGNDFLNGDATQGSVTIDGQPVYALPQFHAADYLHGEAQERTLRFRPGIARADVALGRLANNHLVARLPDGAAIDFRGIERIAFEDGSSVGAEVSQ